MDFYLLFHDEAQKHDSDLEHGKPLLIRLQQRVGDQIWGEGFTISMHAANCRRCAALIEKHLTGEPSSRKMHIQE